MRRAWSLVVRVVDAVRLYLSPEFSVVRCSNGEEESESRRALSGSRCEGACLKGARACLMRKE